MKHKFIRILAIMLVMLLCAGCAVVTPTAPIETHPVKNEFPEESQIMGVVIAQNRGLMALDEDSWLSTTWTVHYDGRVDCTSKHRFSGENTESWNLTQSQTSAVYDLFVANKHTQPTEACDGVGYIITFFERDGSEIYSFEGYVYGTPLEDIEGYLCP